MFVWLVLAVTMTTVVCDNQDGGKAPRIKLNDGNSIPAIGLGTFLGFDENGQKKVQEKEVELPVSWALQAGYRLIDTAQAYFNEEQVGLGVARSGVPREKVFVVTKLSTHKQREVVQALKTSLRRLNMTYVDLYLIHFPVAFKEIKTEEDCLLLQDDIDAVLHWAAENKMEFNPLKCSVISFARKRNPIRFGYSLGSELIVRQLSSKDLGVTFDRKLTFHEHITSVAKTSFQRLGFVLRNSKDFNNIQVIKLLFGEIVRSKLEASACVWHPYESTYTLLLEKVKKGIFEISL